jgi:DNA-directed RNA polymerase alpha subunit
LSKLNNTCYVYVKVKEKNQILEESLNNLLQEVQYNGKELVLAASKDNNRLTRVIEQVLERQQYQYKRDIVEMPTASQNLITSLGSGISLFAALASMNRSMDGEDYDDEVDKKKRKSVKRGI